MTNFYSSEGFDAPSATAYDKSITLPTYTRIIIGSLYILKTIQVLSVLSVRMNLYLHPGPDKFHGIYYLFVILQKINESICQNFIFYNKKKHKSHWFIFSKAVLII